MKFFPSTEEFIQDFRQNINLNEQEEPENNDNQPRSTTVFVQGKLISSWMKCLCLQPTIHPLLQEERKLVFATSKRQLDNENPLHFQVLKTLYKQFTGSRLDCPRYGSHWEQIGFQVGSIIYREFPLVSNPNNLVCQL